MKLRTRLIVGFSLIILIPLVLLSVALWGIGIRQEQKQEAFSQDLLAPSQSQATYDILIDKTQTPSVRLTIEELLLLNLVVMMIASAIIGIWIYRSIAIPLVKLQSATRMIREGNLDFQLEMEGDDEIAQLFQDFELMRLKLKESAEEKLLLDKENSELISNITHDLKTPLTAIEGYIEGILDGMANTPEKMDRYARTIHRKAREMNSLINELTLYSKIDTNRMNYQFCPLDVRDYFDEQVVEIFMELETKGIDMTYENTVEENVTILGDGEQLHRVIDNLISNAVKYQDPSKEKTLIAFRVRDVGDFIQVEIEDNGKGIPEESLKSVFDRFYRTDASRNSSTGGSGIGLSIVRKIIEDHGGKAWASGREGIGTIMYFALQKAQINMMPHKGRGTTVEIPLEEKDE